MRPKSLKTCLCCSWITSVSQTHPNTEKMRGLRLCIACASTQVLNFFLIVCTSWNVGFNTTIFVVARYHKIELLHQTYFLLSIRYQAEGQIPVWHHDTKRWNVSMPPYQGNAVSIPLWEPSKPIYVFCFFSNELFAYYFYHWMPLKDLCQLRIQHTSTTRVFSTLIWPADCLFKYCVLVTKWAHF